MTKVEKIYRIFEKIKIIGVWISGIALLGMMVIIVIDVISRNVFLHSISGGFEFVQNYFMPVAVFPALPFIYSTGVLPQMDLLLDRCNERMKKINVMLVVVIELFIMIFMTLYTWDYAVTGLEKGTAFPASGKLYPLYPLFFFVSIAFGLIIIENIFILIRNFTQRGTTFLFKPNATNDQQEATFIK